MPKQTMPAKMPANKMPVKWLQLHGDPSVRRFLFDQTRVVNEFDECAEDMLNIIDKLMRRHGVFHCRVHCASGFIMGWSMSDPYRYWVLQKEDILDRDFLARFPEVAYPKDAAIKPDLIRPILLRFKSLRLNDENIYLRAGSINIFNGMVELKFSCDGHHYVDHQQFLNSRQYTELPLAA